MLYALLLSSYIYAAKPPLESGLWLVETKAEISAEDKKKIATAVANIPPERKAKVQTMLENALANKRGLSLNEQVKVCITPEMLNSELFLPQDKDCDGKVNTKDAKTYALNYKCKDGSSGRGLWNIKTNKTYSGELNIVESGGNETKVTYKANFLTESCN